MTRSPSQLSKASVHTPSPRTHPGIGRPVVLPFLRFQFKRPSCLPLTDLLFARYQLRPTQTNPDNPQSALIPRLPRTKRTHHIDITIQYADLHHQQQHADNALPYDPRPFLAQQGAHVHTPLLVGLHDGVELVRRVITRTRHQFRALPAAFYRRHGRGEEAVQRRADGAGATTHRLLGRARGADPGLGVSTKVSHEAYHS
ncbi:hypothetical protein F5Y14DRAFT_137112 [Nemania sp. NC0429]|nr:hypothetical protein F5Y14DRAFT_137112 [Nemania sp. NC0429]